MRIVPVENRPEGVTEHLVETEEGVGVLQLWPIRDGRCGWHVYAWTEPTDDMPSPLGTVVYRPTCDQWQWVGDPKQPGTAPLVAGSFVLSGVLAPIYLEHKAAAEAEFRQGVAP